MIEEKNVNQELSYLHYVNLKKKRKVSIIYSVSEG